MRAARLRSQEKAIVRLASRPAIQNYFSSLAPALRNKLWLKASNRYKKSASETYATDVAATAVNEAHLIDYIASSAPTHVIDGWSFLARASEALLKGDLGAALHLAYYAELRAAMSILACEGIGILNTKHPVVKPSGVDTAIITKAEFWQKHNRTYNLKAAGTHSIVWPLLSHWGSLEKAAKLLDGLVAPEGITLRGWLDAVGSPRPVRAISQKWFKSWGLDLGLLNDDHQSRNTVSYRPAELRGMPTPTAPEVIKFVSELWWLFEPNSGGQFPRLERALLKKVLKSSKRPLTAPVFEAALGMSPATANGWAEFFANASDPSPILFAEQASDVNSKNCAFQVISRAALLLFVATGSTRKHLIDAGYTAEDLDFFWRPQCEVRFSGPKENLPENPIDLWQDIADHLLDAEKWRTEADVNASLGEWRKVQAGVANQITSFELAGVWGLVS
ncbi:hypothetical protein SAMN05443579_11618 [Variovorax sp. PDC80]|uniref:hypothetical protein n=1 Tax=Variovorax sp. PDC80 TaxID=1882827 RepID=UPI0008DFBF5D|nr:hypothetical protein [Variovorax sp. PDC80]SFP82982.1 hypothetical protein SAMN05443579_11618 [Variovorax sp. PDC80]